MDNKLGCFLSISSSSFQINPPLGYSIDEYIGELYRMNLSCNSSGGGLPETAESGCLFFKVIGIANIQHGQKCHRNIPLHSLHPAS